MAAPHLVAGGRLSKRITLKTELWCGQHRSCSPGGERRVCVPCSWPSCWILLHSHVGDWGRGLCTETPLASPEKLLKRGVALKDRVLFPRPRPFPPLPPSSPLLFPLPTLGKFWPFSWHWASRELGFSCVSLCASLKYVGGLASPSWHPSILGRLAGWGQLPKL